MKNGPLRVTMNQVIGRETRTGGPRVISHRSLTGPGFNAGATRTRSSRVTVDPRGDDAIPKTRLAAIDVSGPEGGRYGTMRGTPTNMANQKA